MTVEDQRVAHDGMGVAVRKCLGIFYSDDSMVGSRDSECLQHSMNVPARPLLAVWTRV